jgi:deoxyhypusine synthase
MRSPDELTKDGLLSDPIIPIDPASVVDLPALLGRMSQTAFQGKQLGQAFKLWQKMLQHQDTVIILGLAGALVPAGMRSLIVSLIRGGLIDCLVCTGATFFHDLHETRGYHHYQNHLDVSDTLLATFQVDRMHDVLADEEEFITHHQWIGSFLSRLDCTRSFSTREFLYELGARLQNDAVTDGIATAAASMEVPVFCPGIADSAIGIAIAEWREQTRQPFTIDTIQDITELSQIANSGSGSGVIYIGGGMPKNFIQQSVLLSSADKKNTRPHRYAVQITVDTPQWGGLSGCTLEESQSWGKISGDACSSDMVTCNVDATIALPLLVAGLLMTQETYRRPRPKLPF